MAKVKRILIVGGGIAGLALAVALRQRGFTPEIVERSGTWPIAGAGILLHGNSLRALRLLGLDEAVTKAGAVVPALRHLDKAGRLAAEVALSDVWEGVGLTVAIHRHALHAILASAASDVPIRMGTGLVSLRQSGSDIEAILSDGSAAKYDLLVAADGIHSTARDLAFTPSPPSYVQQHYWRTCIPNTGDIVTWTVMRAEGCFLGFIPLGGEIAYCFAQLVTPEQFEDPVAGRRGRLQERFADFGGIARDALPRLGVDESIHFGMAQEIARDRWRAGRVLLIGDAAHACSPIIGQGGAMAMEDAVVLGDVLLSAGSLDQALDDFVVRREPRVRWVRERTHLAIRSMANTTLLERADLSSLLLAEMREIYSPLRELP